MVAQVDVGLKARDPLASDARALQAPDELFALAGEHGTGNDFDAADFGAARSCWDHGANAFAGLEIGGKRAVFPASETCSAAERLDLSPAKHPTRNPAVDFAYFLRETVSARF